MIVKKEFPQDSPSGTPSGKGLYLTIYPSSRPNTDTVYPSSRPNTNTILIFLRSTHYLFKNCSFHTIFQQLIWEGMVWQMLTSSDKGVQLGFFLFFFFLMLTGLEGHSGAGPQRFLVFCLLEISGNRPKKTQNPANLMTNKYMVLRS